MKDPESKWSAIWRSVVATLILLAGLVCLVFWGLWCLAGKIVSWGSRI